MVYQPPEIRRVIPDIISINILMDTCTFTGRWHLALNLLSAVPLLRASANHISHLELSSPRGPWTYRVAPACDPSCLWHSHVLSIQVRMSHVSPRTLTSLVHTVYCIPCMLSQVFLFRGVGVHVFQFGVVWYARCIAWLRGLAQASTR